MNKPKVITSARFTRDMVDALSQYFDDYAVDGVVRIEVTDHGLWWENPDGSRQFLGTTEPFPNAPHRKTH